MSLYNEWWNPECDVWTWNLWSYKYLWTDVECSKYYKEGSDVFQLIGHTTNENMAEIVKVLQNLERKLMSIEVTFF